MAIIKITEHRKKDGGCGWRWIYGGTKGNETGEICCPKCGRRFKLSAKDKRIMKKVLEMNREKG